MTIMTVLPLILYFLYVCLTAVTADKPTVTIVSFVVGEGRDPFHYRRSSASVDMAVEKITALLNDTVTIHYVRRVYDAPCDANHVGAMAAEVYYTYNVTAFIGPACSLALDVVGRMAASWNIPVISPLATNSILGNKDNFPTLTRLYYNMNNWAMTHMALFELYSWQDIAIIHESNHAFYQVVGASLDEEFERAGARVYRHTFNSDHPYNMETLLRRASEKSRVFMVSMRGADLRNTMLLAQRLGMTQGAYVFIYLRISGSSNVWEAGDAQDKAAQKAFEAVLITQLRRPDSPEFLEFETEVKYRSLVHYNYSYGDNAIQLSVANFYDSFMVYAQALTEALALGEDYTDGRLMSSKIWGRNFTGVSGTIAIDTNGDREMDFSLFDLDVATGEYKVVANYYGVLRKFVFEPDSPIQWPNGAGPPPNVPRCGYLGDNPVCIVTGVSTEVIIGIIFTVTILLFILATIFLYRKFKLEADIQSQWWKVKWGDVNPVAQGRTRSSLTSLRTSSMGLRSAAEAYNLTNVALYKGNSVQVVQLDMKAVKIDRTTLIELKQMRDIQCANLTRLLGLCPDTPHICFLTEHCARGSLEDMLHNDEIQLDIDFKLSLLNDIIKGLLYIHTSPLVYHGRFNSSQCLIDGRFVLKITDYGLPSIRRQEEKKPDFNKHVLLYVAPEHLRTDPLRDFSQEGDVYSFAIIMFELLTRSEPYEHELASRHISSILDEVKDRGSHQRPKIVNQGINADLNQLMVDCWDEVPDHRPSINVIKKWMRDKFPRQTGRNILDTLLQRMEQYANNLEGLVDERTHAFLEEKRKADELLFEILPRSVAEKLKNGQIVDPEAYEAVTIYFSDIVGFTTISASSSPLQVIDLLNDLYTCFDSIIDNFEVYKVETIGDAYMVVSGLPIRNGQEHVVQIARMSLAILASVNTFKIRHMTTTPLRARIGLHTGPVCAGVVGRKMPRYCLFGDTVNTASRMESNGQAMKIHISEPTKIYLSQAGNFVVEERGDIDIKGKGSMRTHWLISESNDMTLNCIEAY